MLEKLKRLDSLLSMTPEERRREPREQLVDGKAQVLGETYQLKNWSARGFCIGPCKVERQPGDRLDIRFSVPLPEQRLEFECRTLLVRVSAEAEEIAGVFVNVDAEIQEVIDAHFKVFSPKRYGRDVLGDLKAKFRRSK